LCLREGEAATSLDCVLPHSGVLVIEVVKDRVLDEQGHTITELGEVVAGKGLESQCYEECLLILDLLVLLLAIFIATLSLALSQGILASHNEIE
jgi:hypothetical protein